MFHGVLGFWGAAEGKSSELEGALANVIAAAEADIRRQPTWRNAGRLKRERR